jgi:inosine-uridine nucleoside N-ribohydrolase
MANEKRPVIVDCDPGTDDAWALVALLKAEPFKDYKIIGITGCSGNSTIDHTTLNALAILKLMNRLDVCIHRCYHYHYQI